MYNYDIYMKTESGMTPLNGNASDVEIMTGATAESNGKVGLVPAPTLSDTDKYLKGDGTWRNVESVTKAEQDSNGNKITDTYAKKSIYDDTTISVGRKEDVVIGKNSFALGDGIEASGTCSYAEGNYTTASGACSHAEGSWTKAIMSHSHAEGFYTTVSGNYSHAEGNHTTASGSGSHAEGNYTTASGNYSHAEGNYTTANNYNSHVCGKYNTQTIIDVNLGTAFAIGNGTNNENRSNAFSVTFDGVTKAANTITAETTADYAEFFEWEDENPNGEDRVGKFVTLHNDKIIIARSNEDYILGIISGAPFVLGNGDCDVWNGMYMRDDFGRLIYEPAPKEEFDEEIGAMKEIFDEDGNLVYEGKRRKLNPDYDPTQKYISRFDRPEWSPVGMLGVLSVIQDGTCEVNGYCCCNEEGIATACDKDTIGSYRVIKKISDQIVKVVFR